MRREPIAQSKHCSASSSYLAQAVDVVLALEPGLAHDQQYTAEVDLLHLDLRLYGLTVLVCLLFLVGRRLGNLPECAVSHSSNQPAAN